MCLSLLGTWHGTDETQKWHPDSANLWRVLVSIQGMILIGDPYFNEPNVRSCLPLANHRDSARRINCKQPPLLLTCFQAEGTGALREASLALGPTNKLRVRTL